MSRLRSTVLLTASVVILLSCCARASIIDPSSIAYAKFNGVTVELVGKIVTDVIYKPATQTIDSFYIQEPGSPCGIRVVPLSTASVKSGDVVTVSGSVNYQFAECYIDASDITKTGTAYLPVPMGTSQK